MTPDSEFLAAVERAKLDAMKELAYGASHEINNPLANISARAQTLLRGEADPERRRVLEAIHLQALRAHEMISDLMLFARPPKLALAAVDLSSVLRQVVGELAPECAQRRIELAVAADASVNLTADGKQLVVALKAVIVNSIEAIGAAGRIDVSCAMENHEANGSPHAVVTVRDNGPGIADAVRPHIFDPFFSGREAGRGLGFGLSKAWRIVTEHGGEIVAEGPDQGAAFRIELPIQNAMSS